MKQCLSLEKKRGGSNLGPLNATLFAVFCVANGIRLFPIWCGILPKVLKQSFHSFDAHYVSGMHTFGLIVSNVILSWNCLLVQKRSFHLCFHFALVLLLHNAMVCARSVLVASFHVQWHELCLQLRAIGRDAFLVVILNVSCQFALNHKPS